MSFTNDLIEIALRDIKASRILYDQKLYAQSFFYFQQASEKATKAYGLFAEIINEDDLKKKIQHNQLKIFRKAIEKEEGEIRDLLSKLNTRPDVASHQLIKKDKIVTHLGTLEAGRSFHDRAKQLNLLTYEKEELFSYLDIIEELNTVRIRFSKKVKQALLHEIYIYILISQKNSEQKVMLMK